MITIRKSEHRGHFNLGWLDTYHTFSFDQYYDPNQDQGDGAAISDESELDNCRS